jgi:hypothetical protein
MKWILLITLTAVSGASLTLLSWHRATPPNPEAAGSHASPAWGKSIEGIGYVEPGSELRPEMRGEYPQEGPWSARVPVKSG